MVYHQCYGLHPSNALLKTAVTAARLAGDIILRDPRTTLSGDITDKAGVRFRDQDRPVVGGRDREDDKREVPSHLFLSEETLRQKGGGNYRWIIDPLTAHELHPWLSHVFSLNSARISKLDCPGHCL